MQTTPGRGLYVHVPFCPTVCDFCAFYQEKPQSGAIAEYLHHFAQEVDLWAENMPPVDTVFWGGGTPGLLKAADLETLANQTLRLCKEPPAEWTVELAPSTVKPDKLRVLKEAGVTRISLGVQSFSETMLEHLGRQHSRAQVEKALEMLLAAGFASVNLDLIFAAPGQLLEDWVADLREAASRPVQHLSTYCLTFEEDTALWAKLAKGQVRRDIDTEAHFYEVIPEVLGEAGFAQYEISNFAQSGHACAHNLNTWRMGQWLGLGPSAASQWGNRRWQNVPDLQKWGAALAQGQRAEVEIMPLDGDTLAADYLVFGLRMNAGVDLTEARKRFAPTYFPPEDDWQRYADEGLLHIEGTRIRLTAAGRLVADAIGASILQNWAV